MIYSSVLFCVCLESEGSQTNESKTCLPEGARREGGQLLTGIPTLCVRVSCLFLSFLLVFIIFPNQFLATLIPKQLINASFYICFCITNSSFATVFFAIVFLM